MTPDDLDAEFLAHFADPVERLLLTGAARTVAEAEELVLNTSFDAVAELLRGPLGDEELGRHPLMALYRTRGSAPDAGERARGRRLVVTDEFRLAAIVAALEASGVSCLVMGGHAVRFYGLARDTNDFDFHVSPESWGDLAARLEQCPLFPPGTVAEGPSWRPDSFKRFRIGTLPSGGDEWLEFWRDNHLLAGHADLKRRAVTGRYGGREVPFLGLADLIRSKETERDRDWGDILRLEEFADARSLAALERGELTPSGALATVRSRAGFGRYCLAGTFRPRRRRLRRYRTRLAGHT